MICLLKVTLETKKEELKMDLTSLNFSEFKNKKILITGGSTGIGAELSINWFI